ncbi:MAG TPA: hypothetical protein VIH99_13880 [Bdellovibrionota bacterium]|jgi:hypothetical protein
MRFVFALPLLCLSLPAWANDFSCTVVDGENIFGLEKLSLSFAAEKVTVTAGDAEKAAKATGTVDHKYKDDRQVRYSGPFDDLVHKGGKADLVVSRALVENKAGAKFAKLRWREDSYTQAYYRCK